MNWFFSWVLVVMTSILTFMIICVKSTIINYQLICFLYFIIFFKMCWSLRKIEVAHTSLGLWEALKSYNDMWWMLGLIVYCCCSEFWSYCELNKTFWGDGLHSFLLPPLLCLITAFHLFGISPRKNVNIP